MNDLKWTHRMPYKGLEVRWLFDSETRVTKYLYRDVIFTIESVNPFLVEDTVFNDLKKRFEK